MRNECGVGLGSGVRAPWLIPGLLLGLVGPVMAAGQECGMFEYPGQGKFGF